MARRKMTWVTTLAVCALLDAAVMVSIRGLWGDEVADLWAPTVLVVAVVLFLSFNSGRNDA